MKKTSLLRTSRRGATATEYIVMIILASLIVLGLTRVFGESIKTKFSAANSEFSGTLAEDSSGKGGADETGKYGSPSVDPSAGKGGTSNNKKNTASGGGEESALMDDEESSFNPIILLAVLLLVCLLAYVMFKGKDG